MAKYSSYNTEELIEKFDSTNEKSEDVIKFFNTFTFSNFMSQKHTANNSYFMIKNIVKDDVTKSKITLLLNKLNQQNLTKTISAIREIVFETEEDVSNFVKQCIEKIKNDIDQIRPLVAALCWELLPTYFVTTDKEKIYFRKILLSEVKKEYISSIDYEDKNWSKETAERSMILIGTLFNNKIIEHKIMKSIINDFRKTIEYKEEATDEDRDKVEKALQLTSNLISCIVLNDDAKAVFEDLDTYLESQIQIYEEKKNIARKIRLIGKHTIFELRKK